MIKLLKDIAPNLKPKIDPKLLYRHAAKGEKVHFPEVLKQRGVHKWYDEDAVQDWWTDWQEITVGYREGYKKRGSR
jgi:hypothetical protein